jgi:predicted RNase H-like HicB family nuclease
MSSFFAIKLNKFAGFDPRQGATASAIEHQRKVLPSPPGGEAASRPPLARYGFGMAASVDFTISFESPDEAGWIVARILEVPGAMSQGRTREEARENVVDAVCTVLTLNEDLSSETLAAFLHDRDLLGQKWARKGIEQLRRGELVGR